jgi:alpha-L-arabinofuranosidase
MNPYLTLERNKRTIMHQRQCYLASIAALAVVAFFTVQLPAAGPAEKTGKPDFTKGDKIPETATHDWNLGPTGARGWMYSNKMETSEARQIFITQVEKGAPADGVLDTGDVILGIADEPFSYDPRTEMGKAITAAESGSGTLSLVRWRKGEVGNAVLRLPVLGTYSATAPFDCPKSKRIFEQGCNALAGKMTEDPDKGNPIERSLNALALLSSGKPEYLPLVRQQVAWASQYSDPERKSLHSWWYGYVNMLVAEYVLATGDRAFMPDLKRITMEIVHGQSEVGSWGHRFVQPENGRLAGYGMMNAPGLPLTVSLILARQAGVNDPALDKAIEKSERLIRFYIGKGSVPYGDHHPWIQTHEDNGKNGVAALMFHLLDNARGAEYFSRMSVASHGGERDTGHTGNFFNMLWAMPGVSQSGPHATGAWMQEFGWYYDLARGWDGTYLHQGPPAQRPDSYRNWDCTGVYLLAYGLPLKKIHLTGKKKGTAPQVDATVAESLVADGRGWSPKDRIASYAARSEADIFAGLKNWSPVVRERSAMELAKREGDPAPRLIEMLDDSSLYARYGACQALIMLKERAVPAVPALKETLKAEDLWLRIKAAEALARIGGPAMSTVPDLLEMLAQQDPKSDPRGMQQRYLCFALFNSRDGMLGRSLEGVDRELLYAAVRAGLRNEDGRARGSVGSVYKNLTHEEIEPLLPAIHQAVIEPAPSGIMFADGIRLSGLEILAKHRIKEGLPMCVSLIDLDRWGARNRVKRCLAILRVYGGAAKSEVPRIQELEKELLSKRWKPDEIQGLNLPVIIKEIEEDRNPPALRSLNQPSAKTTTISQPVFSLGIGLLALGGLNDTELDVSEPAAQNLLPSDGFEAANPNDATLPVGWEKEILSEGKAKVSTQLLKEEGRTGGCLFISALAGEQNNPARVLWKSTVKVKPKTIYRLSAWIRTEKAAWRGKGVFLQVSGTENSQTRSLKGTHRWTRVSSVFQAPENVSSLVVECQFGSGAGGTVAGKAWIDDVQLEALPDKVLYTKRFVINTKSPLKKYDPMIFGGFIEHFQDQIYGGLFEPGSPLSDERGFRKDVIATMKELKLSVVRWPGGCFVSGYHWKDGVGKTRTPVADPVWGVTDPNTFGTDEFVEWCRLVGCEPYICTNAGNGTPEEMKQWVEYCNATEGEYAELRKANGHEKPLNVKYWSIGNENYGPWEIGRKTAQQWGPLVDQCAELMRAADPSIILAAAATKREDWSLPLLAAAGKHLEYIAVHEYWLGYWSKNAMPAYQDCIRASEGPERTIQTMLGILEKAGLRGRVKIAFDEWNLRGWHHPGFPRKKPVAPDDKAAAEFITKREINKLPQQYTMADALFSASFFNACLRHCEDVGMTNVAPIVNTRGPLFVHPKGIVKRTTFHTMALYANEIGSHLVQADDVDGQRFGEMATVDSLVTTTPGSNTWKVLLINRHPSETANCLIKIDEKGPISGEHPAVILTADSPEAYNSIENPERVKPKKITAHFQDGATRVPPHSMVIITLDK